MTEQKVPASPGEVIAYRADGATLVFDYTSSDGYDIGHIVMGDGEQIPQAPLVSILSHGYWTAEPTQN